MNQACPPFSRGILARDLASGDYIKLPAGVGPRRAQTGVARVAKAWHWQFGQIAWLRWEWGAYSNLDPYQKVLLFEGDD
jgi:hypothetical protein